MSQRSKFPPVFWVANLIEVLERFSYYGIYFGFGIYMTHLGFSRSDLGLVQSVFLAVSYFVPVISGTMADKYGFKKVLIVSYVAYLPAILLLLVTESFSGIAITMLLIGMAAGIFKPLISGTVRAVTDGSNKTLGFGIFYAMVNVGGSFGPIVAGYLRAISWKYAFIASAVSIGVMLVITVLFYKEPPREADPASLGDKLVEILTVLKDLRFSSFLLILGVFFWLPFWAFFNLCAVYVDTNVDTAELYRNLDVVLGAIPLLGPWLVGVLSHEVDGTRRVLGETISHTGYIIMVLQIFVSARIERWRAIPAFMLGLLIAAAGMVVLGFAVVAPAALVFAGIFLFAVGEMIASPRIQEYITWIAPKEKAGLYMGTNFIAVGIGGLLSGVIYTAVSGAFIDVGHPEYVWYVLAAHLVVGIAVINLFTRVAGEFSERQA
ncbi:MAG TPA: MFS transporter [Candidatus Polarisedimenticolaceae bacterium]|nr:MFS transporter [Candidatus Polarisedimenticolaceae bacterium]